MRSAIAFRKISDISAHKPYKVVPKAPFGAQNEIGENDNDEKISALQASKP